MARGQLPLLMFPARAKSEREGLGRNIDSLRVPDIARQRARIGPQLAVLQGAMEARRILLQRSAPLENPELVLVLEVIGAISNFAKAVSRVEGLEWLFELAEDQIPPDEDFHEEDEDKRDRDLKGRPSICLIAIFVVVVLATHDNNRNQDQQPEPNSVEQVQH